MFPGMPPQGNKQERHLVKILKSLDDANQANLIAFAEFLQSRTLEANGSADPEPAMMLEPIDIPRPDGESVIKAIKRLSVTYPMVDKENILHPISDLMTSHMIQGRKATEVIDDLQQVFLKEYESLLKVNKKHD